jgi:hypothetical protein
MTKKLDSKLAEKIVKKAGLIPLEPYSGNNLRWKCKCLKCKSTVYPTLTSIKRGSNGCKKCADKNNGILRRTSSEVAIKLMLKANLKPLENFKTSNSKWKCKCLKCGKIVEPTLSQIKTGSKCAYCAGNRIDSTEAISKMISAGLMPLKPYKNSKSPWKSKCIVCKKIVSPRFTHVKHGVVGCKYCNYIKSADAQKIPEKTAIQIMKNASLKPLEPYKNSNSKWKSRCLKCDSTGYPTLAQIKQGFGGCIPCGYKKGSDKNRKDDLIAKTIMSDANLKPLEPYKNSNARWKSQCLKCMRTVNPRLSSIIQGQSGCEYCAGKKVDANDAHKIMIAAGVKPLEPFKRTNIKWKSKCLKCRRIVFPTYSNVQGGTGGCGYCGGRIVDPSEAVKIMLKSALKPLKSYPGADKRWECQCLKCKKIVFPTYSHVRDGHTGCIFCAPVGINQNKPSFIYLITNEKLNAHKIGVGNVNDREDRVQKFRKKGWETHKVWQIKTGKSALQIEKLVLKVLRKDLALEVYLSKEDMPVVGGHTETVSADSITLLELEKIIKKVMKFEEIKSVTNLSHRKTKKDKI